VLKGLTGKQMPFFVGVLACILIGLAFYRIDSSWTCEATSKPVNTYHQAFERANEYHTTGQKRNFLILNLWVSAKTRKCYELAIEGYSQALLIEPTHKDALNNRAGAYRFLEEYDKALNDYQTILLLGGSNHALLGIAQVYEQSEQLDLAIPAYEKALQFMKQSSYWTNLHPDSIREYERRLARLQERVEQIAN